MARQLDGFRGFRIIGGGKDVTRDLGYFVLVKHHDLYLGAQHDPRVRRSSGSGGRVAKDLAHRYRVFDVLVGKKAQGGSTRRIWSDDLWLRVVSDEY